MEKNPIQMANLFLFQNCAKFEFTGIALAHVLVWVLFVSAYVLNFLSHKNGSEIMLKFKSHLTVVGKN